MEKNTIESIKRGFSWEKSFLDQILLSVHVKNSKLEKKLLVSFLMFNANLH